MSFCKICLCGEKIVFEERNRFPGKCPKCSRDTFSFRTYNLDVEEDVKTVSALTGTSSQGNAAETGKAEQTENKPEEADNRNISAQVEERLSSILNSYALVLENGKEIVIPEGGCTVGRTEAGAEELAEYGSVSRKHLIITPTRRGILIEDVSRYGTFIDGNKIPRNEPTRVFAGAKITLCNVEATLVAKEKKE